MGFDLPRKTPRMLHLDPAVRIDRRRHVRPERELGMGAGGWTIAAGHALVGTLGSVVLLEARESLPRRLPRAWQAELSLCALHGCMQSFDEGVAVRAPRQIDHRLHAQGVPEPQAGRRKVTQTGAWCCPGSADRGQSVPARADRSAAGGGAGAQRPWWP